MLSAPACAFDSMFLATLSVRMDDSASDRYTYVWKTQKTWASSCRRFVLKLKDQSEFSADFGFTK